MNRFLFRSLALLSLAGPAALSPAQVLYTPSGSVGTSSTGNVGIGTTAPATLLHLSGGGVRIDVGWGIALQNQDGVGNTLWSIKRGNSVDGNDMAIRSYSGFTFAPANTDTVMVRIANNGNVGIGTTSPNALLSLAGSDSTTQQLSLRSNDPNWFGRIGQNVNGASIGLLLSSGGTWTLNGTTFSATKDYNGSFPSAALAVMNQYNGAQITRFSFLRKANGSSQSDGAVTELMVIDGNGNVGIGTTNPTYPLTVRGTVRAMEVIVDTGWSDYVFKPGYRLASLNEVQTTIEKEGHLPGIPSAKEVAEHGISVGDMQARLLAKIEELTLHQIAQEKEQAHLRQRVDQLEKENSSLRTALGSLQKP